MMSAQHTTALTVTRVDFDVVRFDDGQALAWGELRDAAAQDDPALAAVYAAVLRDAETMAQQSRRFRSEVRGGWGAWTAAFWGPGGVGVPRHSDEGMAKPVPQLAEREERVRAARLIDQGWRRG